MSYCYELILHLNQLLSLFIVPVTLKQLTTSLITTAKLSILDVCGGFSYASAYIQVFCSTFEDLSVIAQPAFTCLKLTIETLKQGVKYGQS